MLRLSELYASVQGEGPRVGIPTQFVRFAGCNMRCPGWPCDTQHAIDPAIWRVESEKLSAVELAQKVYDLSEETGAINICLTGGEPFLQPNGDLLAWVQELNDMAPDTFMFEAFTNGSFKFPEWRKQVGMDVMMDWKLESSGEAETERDNRIWNAAQHSQSDGIKFVVKNHADLEEAMNWSVGLDLHGYQGRFWVGRVWDAELTDKDIVDFILTNGCPWSLNVQIHKYIWPADERGV